MGYEGEISWRRKIEVGAACRGHGSIKGVCEYFCYGESKDTPEETVKDVMQREDRINFEHLLVRFRNTYQKLKSSVTVHYSVVRSSQMCLIGQMCVTRFLSYSIPPSYRSFSHRVSSTPIYPDFSRSSSSHQIQFIALYPSHINASTRQYIQCGWRHEEGYMQGQVPRPPRMLAR